MPWLFVAVVLPWFVVASLPGFGPRGHGAGAGTFVAVAVEELGTIAAWRASLKLAYAHTVSFSGFRVFEKGKIAGGGLTRGVLWVMPG